MCSRFHRKQAGITFSRRPLSGVQVDRRQIALAERHIHRQRVEPRRILGKLRDAGQILTLPPEKIIDSRVIRLCGIHKVGHDAEVQPIGEVIIFRVV
ncbi:hypothetical protein D3C78_1395040 [compost metagenome]